MLLQKKTIMIFILVKFLQTSKYLNIYIEYSLQFIEKAEHLTRHIFSYELIILS